MRKKRITISIDPDVHAQAKEIGLNISGVAEKALQSYIAALTGGESQIFPIPEAHDRIDNVNESSTIPSGNQHSSELTNSNGESLTDTDEILRKYENYAKTVLDRSERTVNQHLRYIERLLRRAERPPAEILKGDIIDYIESEKPMSSSKKDNILSALRVFFREFVGSNVASHFEMPTQSPTPTRVPTKNELQTFYNTIENPKYRVIFLMYATSGLRSSELLELTIGDIDEEMQMLLPRKESDVKKTWVSFYNKEAKYAYEEFKPRRDPDDTRLFQAAKPTVNTIFRRLSKKSDVKITPQILRRWFASEMSSLGVDSSYVDAFCGRTPSSVLEKHYLDYSPRKLKQIYDGAGLTVLE
jgi:integrase